MKTNHIGTFILAIVMLGCSSSKITSSWKAPDATNKKFNKVMVVGLIKESDRTLREKMEQHMIGDLKELGYNAVSAYEVYGPKAFNNLDENAVVEKLKNSNVDAVVTIVLLNKEKENFYKAGGMMFTPYASRYNRFWGYYTTLYDRIYSPGYYAPTTKYFWESNFYDLTTKELLYSVQTQSFDPASSESLAHEYGKMIVANMVKKSVLLKQ
ncbi:hypothetical protein [Ferruginibacter sp. SUN106]|uniref:hypothetical protein n=1 Tax=Ferruginibacter sp. SUN106 TaxID=2978348 RepID=UPI003D366F6E